MARSLPDLFNQALRTESNTSFRSKLILSRRTVMTLLESLCEESSQAALLDVEALDYDLSLIHI